MQIIYEKSFNISVGKNFYIGILEISGIFNDYLP